MKPKTWTHPKFSLLQRRLGICPALAAGILEGIWHLAATFDAEGGKLPYTDDELAAWLGVELAPDELLAALVDGRWVDDAEDGLRVHDWHDHRPTYVDKRVKEQARYRQRQTCQTTSRPAQTCADLDRPAETCIPSASASASAYKVHGPRAPAKTRAADVDLKEGGRKNRKKSTGRAPVRTAVTVEAIADRAVGIFDACRYRGEDGGNLWGVAALLESGIGDLTEAEVYSACQGAALNGKDKPAHFFACLAESVGKRGHDLTELLRRVTILPAWPKTKSARAAGGDS